MGNCKTIQVMFYAVFFIFFIYLLYSWYVASLSNYPQKYFSFELWLRSLMDLFIYTFYYSSI